MALIIVEYDGETPPEYAHWGDAGADLRASESCVIPVGKRRLVDTGVKVNIPHGQVGYVMSRSGLAHKYGIAVLNAPGVIDSGYLGNVKVNLINLGESPFVISKGDRIAQLVTSPISLVQFEHEPTVFNAESTARGNGGHGSTGI